MKETIVTSVRGAYERPSADIVEFAVERGFDASGVNFDTNNGNEYLNREDVTDPWHA